MLAGASGKAHVKPLTYFSALMTLLGVALLVEKGGAFNPTQGDAWSLASAIFFGVQVGISSDSSWLENGHKRKGMGLVHVVWA